MSNKTRRVGAFATAAMFLGLLFTANGSSASAQTEGENPFVIATGRVAIEVEADPVASPVSEMRFVASPVVQPLPDDANVAETDPVGDYHTLPELVAATEFAEELGREMTCLAQAVYFESRGEPLAGQLAVARVIINRTASPLFPDDYCSVVTQKSQFSFVRGGRIPAANTRSDAWQRAVQIARIAHQDLWPSAARDALFFHADHVRPRWANRKTARATIDSHIFYR